MLDKRDSKTARRIRLEWIKQEVERKGEVNRQKLISACMIIFGVSKRDAREEIEAVVNFEEYEEEKGYIKSHGEPIQKRSEAGVEDKETA